MLRVCLRVHPVGEDGAVALADSLLAADDEDVYLAVVAFDRGDRRTWRARKVIRLAAVFDPVPPVPGAVVPDPVGEDGAVALADSLLAADDEDVYLAVVAFDRGDRRTWLDLESMPVAEVFDPVPPVPGAVVPDRAGIHSAVAANDEDLFVMGIAFDRGQYRLRRNRKVIGKYIAVVDQGDPAVPRTAI